MSLFVIVGELGSGKTLTMTYLAWSNWLRRKRRVYSNYTLYGFPFTRIRTIRDLEEMKEGVVVFDELWISLSSWSRNKTVELISSILLKSRKRGLTLIFTSQTLGQINKRIREVLDFIAYPILGPNNEYCKVEVFRGPRPSLATRLRAPIYFDTEPMYAVYDTYEEVKPFEPSDELTAQEEFHPIIENKGWLRYLKRQKGIKKWDDVLKYSAKIMKKINPDGITSESQRETAEGFVV